MDLTSAISAAPRLTLALRCWFQCVLSNFPSTWYENKDKVTANAEDGLERFQQVSSQIFECAHMCAKHGSRGQ